ncbi:amidohydrolase family protein [Emergencia timonensis]|uniref:amidohydrolase family protein n=1 Tax=Emergencia timonensis TaxID=1776384 RepID=UPI000832D57D|nr:amidohydrolase family protein [Emergencia timonensis]
MKYAFTHANLLDGSRDMEVRPSMTVLVENDKIVSLKEKGSVPEGFEEIDLQGRYLMPGLINAHVHLPGTGKPTNASEASDLAAKVDKSKLMQTVLSSVVKKNILTSLNAGITTIRSVGEVSYRDLANRDMINIGKYVGPRVLACGYGVTVHGGHTDGLMGIPCETPEECVKVIRDNAAKGADWIKIFVTGGGFDAAVKGEPGVVRMPYELAKASCDEAHKLGFKVASHTESTEGVRIALKAGVDTIEHGARMDEEIIRLYKENGSAVICTIIPALAIARLPGEMTKMTEVNQYNAEVVMENIIESAKQALANDIPVGLGTDASCPYITHYALWREVYYFAKFCGVSNAFALHTVTLRNAEILGLSEITGSIEDGKCADLIVTEQNPLEDLTALKDVSLVMARGHFIREPKVKRIDYIDQELDKLL